MFRGLEYSMVIAGCVMCSPLWDSVGGENMVLVFNPNEENVIRVANAYAKIRQIPDRNIVFLAPPTSGGYTRLWLTADQAINSYITPPGPNQTR